VPRRVTLHANCWAAVLRHQGRCAALVGQLHVLLHLVERRGKQVVIYDVALVKEGHGG